MDKYLVTKACKHKLVAPEAVVFVARRHSGQYASICHMHPKQGNSVLLQINSDRRPLGVLLTQKDPGFSLYPGGGVLAEVAHVCGVSEARSTLQLVQVPDHPLEEK